MDKENNQNHNALLLELINIIDSKARKIKSVYQWDCSTSWSWANSRIFK